MKSQDKTFTFKMTGEIDIVATNEQEALGKLFDGANGLVEHLEAELVGIDGEGW